MFPIINTQNLSLDLVSVSLCGISEEDSVTLNLNNQEEINYFLSNGGDKCFQKYMSYATWNGSGYFAACIEKSIVYINF